MQVPTLKQVEQRLGLVLPESYARYIEASSGFLRDDGLLLCSMTELVERNVIFGVPEFVPGFVMIADDSGGRGLFLHWAEQSDDQVYLCHFGDLTKDEMVPIASSFNAWRLSGFPLPT